MNLILLIAFFLSTFLVKEYVSIKIISKSVEKYYKLIHSIKFIDQSIDSINEQLNEIRKSGLDLLKKLIITITPYLVVLLACNLLNIKLPLTFLISILSYILGMILKNK